MTRPTIEQYVTFHPVADLERAAAFYQGVLGLELALDQGTCRIYRVCAGAFLGVCQREDARPAEGVIVTLVSQDVDGWARHLESEGVALEKPPTLNPDYDIYHLFVRDPDGHLVEIQRFEDPAWPPAPARTHGRTEAS
jgi:catechol 2,3-dioxygenase-like lactoylglutathione lyase family enzyme